MKMTKLKLLIVPTFMIMGMLSVSCTKNQGENEPFAIAGDTIDVEGAVAANTLPALLAGYDSFECKLKGTINVVCQTKGCWMTMPISEEEDLLIRFKDYGFFVPMNSSDHQAVVKGIAYVDTIDIAERKHLAMDKGMSEDEIAQINKPEIKYSFMASGVYIE